MKRSVESMIFASDSNPYGITFPEWTVRWWRWLVALPKSSNPAFDMSGTYAELRQNDPNVWFLAGTFGGLVERKCRIPSGKSILMPVINYECSFAEEPSITTKRGLESKCKSEIDDIKDVSFMIDDLLLKDLSAYRICSPLFTVQLQDDNVLGVKPCSTKMTCDGFWIFLKPLMIGKHQITTFGSCRSGKIRIGASYDLLVS